MAERQTSLFVSDRRLKRRKAVNLTVELAATLAALAAVAVLVVVIVSVARRGASALDWHLLTKAPVNDVFGGVKGGIADAIVGSAVIVGLATVFALPIGVLVAIFVSELAPPRIGNVIRLVLDVINGIPTIVTGIFVFTVLVLAHGQSAFAGALAYAVIALPLIARSTQEVLYLVPSSLREAGLALGASRWRTVLGIIVPTSLGGIVTGTVLAIARIAGETAPMLFTSSLVATGVVTYDPRQPMMTIPLLIFEYSDLADTHAHAIAWAAGIVLLGFVLVTSLVARAVLARSRRKLGQ